MGKYVSKIQYMLFINVGERTGSQEDVCPLQDVTRKIGKAFNVMQYLSNYPIKITPIPTSRLSPALHIHPMLPPMSITFSSLTANRNFNGFCFVLFCFFARHEEFMFQ